MNNFLTSKVSLQSNYCYNSDKSKQHQSCIDLEPARVCQNALTAHGNSWINKYMIQQLDPMRMALLVGFELKLSN